MNIFKKIFGNNQNDKKEVITMTNTEKAIRLINTFATGDTEKASELLAENYIQHNLAYGTGRDAFVGSVSYLASAPVKTTVNNIRAFEDGDKVFLQTVYNFAGVGEQVAFDIFRFDENGKIAEHWDNIASKDGIVGRVPRRHRIKRYRPVSPKSRPPGARHRPASTPSEAQRHHCSRSSVSTYRTVSSRNKLSVMGTAKNTDAGLANRSASDNAAVCSSQRRAITV